jgi:glycosyltransferase involved in cell wall biosynthesis
MKTPSDPPSFSRPLTLVISNIAWSFVWQRHQTLATLFALDTDVVFLEVPGIRRVSWRDFSRLWERWRLLRGGEKTAEQSPAGVQVKRFFLLPATNVLFHAVNARLVARWLSREAGIARGVETILNYSPSRTALQLIDRVPRRHLIYDCTDDWLAVRSIPSCLKKDEEALLAEADLTLVPSQTLWERKLTSARRIVRLPHGALVERFRMARKPPPVDGRLTVLYYGHLHAQHLDFHAIESLANARPHWRVKLVGPVKTPYGFPSNVEVIGQQPHEALRDFIADADVLLLPYVINDYTRAVLPAKVYECLATGRPVVAAPLPELTAHFSQQLVFAAENEWAEKIEEVLAADSVAASEARVALAEVNTWESRYREILDLLRAPAR